MLKVDDMTKGGTYLACFIAVFACTAWTEPLVRVGDSTEAVGNHLGEPDIEFPLNGQLVQDYGHCVITSENGVVVSIKQRDKVKPAEADDASRPVAPTISGLMKKAKDGDAESQYLLGYCYQTGQVVEKNMDEAIRWYTFAAMQSHMPAQHNLGCIYMQGEGVPRDYEQAFTWAILAERNGNNELLMMLRNRVTEEQKAAAFARAQRIRDGLEESPYGSPDDSTALVKVEDNDSETTTE